MAKKKVSKKEPKWTTKDLGGKEIWDSVRKLQKQVDQLEARFNALLVAIDKCKRVKGI